MTQKRIKQKFLKGKISQNPYKLEKRVFRHRKQKETLSYWKLIKKRELSGELKRLRIRFFFSRR